jgi:hypothetical protein
VGFLFGSLEYCVGAPECYFRVIWFEEVGELPNLGAVKGEGDPFFVLVVFIWCLFLFVASWLCVLESCYC